MAKNRDARLSLQRCEKPPSGEEKSPKYGSIDVSRQDHHRGLLLEKRPMCSVNCRGQCGCIDSLEYSVYSETQQILSETHVCDKMEAQNDIQEHNLDTDLNKSINDGSHIEKCEPITKRRKMILLITMTIMIMSGGMLFGMIGPFFPTVAKQKGATPFLSGFVLGSYEFTMIFAAPIMGNFISRIGVRFTYTAGIMVTGVCSVLFGFLIWCPDEYFIPMCVIVRILQGTGCAAFITSTYATAVTLYTKEMAFIFGILETMNGVGFMVGPIVGSGWYAIGGYLAPFLAIGITILIFGAAISRIIPNFTENTKSELSIWSLFAIPMEVVCGLLHASVAYMFSNFDATFALHFEQFELRQIYVSLLFFAIGAGYCCLTPIVGKITDKLPNMAYIFLVVGFLLHVCSIFMAGPAPFLPLPRNNLALITVSIICVGLTESTLVVTFTIMFSIARMYDFPDNMDTYGKISGFVVGFYNTGAFIGPIAGGLAFQELGWEWSFTICGFLFLACILLLVLLLLWQKLVNGIDFTSGLSIDTDKTMNEIKPEENVVKTSAFD